MFQLKLLLLLLL